jgi:hypothetical protein
VPRSKGRKRGTGSTSGSHGSGFFKSRPPEWGPVRVSRREPAKPKRRKTRGDRSPSHRGRGRGAPLGSGILGSPGNAGGSSPPPRARPVPPVRTRRRSRMARDAARRPVAEARAEGAGVSKKTRPAGVANKGAGRGSPGLGRPPRRSLYPGTGIRPPFHVATSRRGLRRSGPSARMWPCFDWAKRLLSLLPLRGRRAGAQSPCSAAFRAARRNP